MPVSQIYTEPGMEDLAGWYGQIRTLLDRAQIKPEALTDIAVTPKWLSVRGDGIQCGLAFRFGGEHAVYGSQDFRPLLERCKPWRGRALTAVIEALLAQSGLCERILCLAALNALSAEPPGGSVQPGLEAAAPSLPPVPPAVGQSGLCGLWGFG